MANTLTNSATPLLSPDEVQKEIQRSIEYLEGEEGRFLSQLQTTRTDLERFYAARNGISVNDAPIPTKSQINGRAG